jgi:UDP-N-acetylmuramate dehydrogenase
MQPHINIPLKNYLTMQIGGPADQMVDAHTPDELAQAITEATQQGIPHYIIGGGSNVIAHDEGFRGRVIRNRIGGFEVVAADSTSTTIKIGGGENWDEVVKRTVEMNLSGIEALSGIPGTAGAAPVQNIGAYGQEVAETLVELDAYDSQEDAMVTLKNEQCGFSYRHSIFRGTAAGRYAICSITLRLYTSLPQPPFYAPIQAYFDEHEISLITPQEVRTATLAIRTNKLPDPAQRPNSGSFFKNSIVDTWLVDELLQRFPAMPHYDMGDGTQKIPTGWLIEQTGLKGQLLHGMRVHDKNCLVLINESARGYSDLAAARDEIATAVRDMFRISIVQKPLEL